MDLDKDEELRAFLSQQGPAREFLVLPREDHRSLYFSRRAGFVRVHVEHASPPEILGAEAWMRLYKQVECINELIDAMRHEVYGVPLVQGSVTLLRRWPREGGQHCVLTAEEIQQITRAMQTAAPDKTVLMGVVGVAEYHFFYESPQNGEDSRERAR